MEDRGANVGGHASVAAGMIVAYWLADGYVIGLPVAALAATWNPLIVFIGAVALVTSINLAACRWINAAWTSWASGRISAKLMRSSSSSGRGSLFQVREDWIRAAPDGRASSPDQRPGHQARRRDGLRRPFVCVVCSCNVRRCAWLRNSAISS